MIYIAKDIHETLDYIFVTDVNDPISGVTAIQQEGASMVVDSCYVNTFPIVDSYGKQHPAGRVIVLWVRGGSLNTSEKLRIQYSTQGGRVLDADVVFRFTEYNFRR